MREILPEFGKHLAIDSTAISSFAKRQNNNQTADGRRETDADYGKKEYRFVREDGTLEKIVKWFGYNLHLIVDTIYELPVAFKVTKASASDIAGEDARLDQMQERQP
ncbi:MAG: Mobile element protein [Candidatus Carbobacillus altaicus]|uniref:Mobile element protein n=1 Tax=Candidatus Carbonibacillus altaicus TaxID=2163959 RepID=A0A2R6Y529_9BACL|nr:MAG: Mobile element protein [Candidatus Carbobacillus altaicus]